MVRSHRMMEAASDSSAPVRASAPISSIKSTRGSEKSERIDVTEFSDEQIHGLLHALRKELHERAMASDDPEVLGIEFLSRLNGNDVAKPEIAGERFVALGGVIKYNPAGTKHQCVLYSVVMPGADPFWAWEDHGTLAYSQSARIAETRQSVAVHVAVDGMQFIKHTMKHDGERHVRLSEEAWDCVWAENGAGSLQIVRSKSTPRHLPMPNH